MFHPRRKKINRVILTPSLQKDGSQNSRKGKALFHQLLHVYIDDNREIMGSDEWHVSTSHVSTHLQAGENVQRAGHVRDIDVFRVSPLLRSECVHK